MNIQPFIFNWNRQFEKSCAIEDSLKKIFDKVTVINSDDNNTREGWIDIGDESYFSDQFRKALELFDGDVLLHVQGDVSYDKWEELVEDAKKYLEYYDAGIYHAFPLDCWRFFQDSSIALANWSTKCGYPVEVVKCTVDTDTFWNDCVSVFKKL